MRCQKILLLLVIAILVSGCVAPGVYQTGDVVTYNPDARMATIVLDERGDEFLTASIYSDSLDRCLPAFLIRSTECGERANLGVEVTVGLHR